MYVSENLKWDPWSYNREDTWKHIVSSWEEYCVSLKYSMIFIVTSFSMGISVIVVCAIYSSGQMSYIKNMKIALTSFWQLQLDSSM